MLSVPGDRPERYEKAIAAGADAVIFDLEDAVGQGQKDEARRLVAAYFDQQPASPDVLRGIRVNNIHTLAGLRDIEVLACMARLPDFVALPKVESSAEVLIYDRHLGRAGSNPELVCIVETALGLERALDIATATSSTAIIGFGGGDLAADLGTELSWENMLPARMRIIQAAAAARISAMDMPWFDIGDAAGLADEARLAKRLGFRCKLAIHPRQVAVIADNIGPTAEETAWARRVVEAFEQNAGRAFQLDGRMIDEPIYQQQRRVLAVASAGVAVPRHAAAQSNARPQ